MKHSKKQTTKLKVGRRLPKGDNLTDTTFKTRKIQIRSQEKQYVGKPEDKQKFDVLELLKSLHSNNVSVKLSTLSKLSEFVSSTDYSNSNEKNEIFRSLIHLMLNEEVKVRKQALKIIENVLKELTDVGSHPILLELKAYISSATTHLNAGIRNDSLKLLMLNLKYLPTTICKLHTLLNNVLGLISQKPNTNIPAGAHSSSLLIAIPSERHSTLEWRNSVLKCIFTFLQANVACVKPEDEPKPMPDWDMKVKFSVQQFYFSPCYPYRYNKEAILSNGCQEMDFNTNKTTFGNFIKYLILVLFEIWIEVTSSTTFNDKVYYNECLETQTVILDIICLLVEWINYTESKEYLGRVLYSAYNEKIRMKFFQHFPYSETRSSYINVRLCQIYCDIIAKAQHSPNLSMKISQFLLDSVNQDLKVEEMEHIFQFLKNLLEYKNIAHLYEPHLKTLYLKIDRLEDEHCRLAIFNFFMDLMSVIPKLTTIDENHILIKVLKYIPTEFLKLSSYYVEDIHSDFIHNILRVTGCWKLGIQEGIAEHFQEIAYLMTSNNAVVRIVAVELIGKSQFISQEQFAVLASVIRQEDIIQDIVEYLFIELTGLINAPDPVFRNDHLLYFFLNLRFGRTLLEDAVQMPFNNFEHCIPFTLSSYTIVEDILPSTKDFTDIIARSINHFRERKKVYSAVQGYLTYVLGKSHTISFHVALSVLRLAKDVMNVVTVPEDFWLQVADLNIGCFLYAISLCTQFASQNTGDTDPNHDMYIKLLNHTFNIEYLYKILARNSREIKNINYVRYVEQLMVQIFNAPLEELNAEDFKAIAIFLTILDHRFNDYFSQREWFQKVYSKCSPYL